MSATILSPATVSPTSKQEPPGVVASVAHLVKDLRLASEKLDAIESARVPIGQLAGDYERKGVLVLEFLAYLQGVEGALKGEEKQATRELKKVYRKHLLYQWSRHVPGLGEKQMGRFLAAIGNADPTWRQAQFRDDKLVEEARLRRGPGEFRQYCGFGDPDQKRRKGEQSNWNSTAKMRVRMIAESCIRQRCPECTAAERARREKPKVAAPWAPPPLGCRCAAMNRHYRVVYDEARIAWADRDTTDLHKDNHALRIVAKEVLKDMWREMHNLRGDQVADDTQTSLVPADFPSTAAAA